MAKEFNVTATDKFFLGENKILQLEIFDEDGVTPFDVTDLPVEWILKKTDKATDAIIRKIFPGQGITIVGVFNISPTLNTQRIRVNFASEDTDPAITSLLPVPYTLKANIPYRHSLRRMDTGNKAVLSFGSITFLQAP